MSLLERYPKTHRDAKKRLEAVLQRVPGLGPRQCEDFALAINNMADKAVDLNEIFQHILDRDTSEEELAELLIAFELTTEQIRGDSDTINGQFYELGDRLKELAKTSKR
jgi:hypothetical protein